VGIWQNMAVKFQEVTGQSVPFTEMVGVLAKETQKVPMTSIIETLRYLIEEIVRVGAEGNCHAKNGGLIVEWEV